MAQNLVLSSRGRGSPQLSALMPRAPFVERTPPRLLAAAMECSALLVTRVQDPASPLLRSL